jgi:hypothetical protein
MDPKLAVYEEALAIDGPKEIIVECGDSGTPDAGELDKVYQYTLRADNIALTTGVAWSRTTPDGITTTISGTGTATLQVTALTTDPVEIELTAARTDRADMKYKVNVRKNLAPPPSGGGSGGGIGGNTMSQTGGFAAISSGTAAVVSNELEVTVGSGAQVTYAAAINAKAARASPDGTWLVRFQWELWNGSAWVSEGATFDISPSTEVQFVDGIYINYPGSTGDSQDYSSSAGATVKMRLTGWIVSGSSTDATKTINLTGQISMQG